MRSSISSTVAFYVEQHNSVMPHSAFRGATPDEVFFGLSDSFEPDLIAARRRARAARIAANRVLECSDCHAV